MGRVLELKDVINMVMGKDPAQVEYKLNDEEVRSMQVCLPALRPICEGTDKVQMNDTNLRVLHSIKTILVHHVEEMEKEPTQVTIAKVIKGAMKRHTRLGHIDEHAAACAFMLDPKKRFSEG
eukprot:EG_transcript_51420